MRAKAATAAPRDLAKTAAVAIAGACAFLSLYAPQPLLPRLARLFAVGAGQISLMVSAATLGVALGAPFVGMLADRFGRKPVIVISLFGLALSTALCATATTLAELVAWRFLTGLSTPGIIASILAYISEEWAAGRAARMVAIYVSSTVLGGFLGRFSAGFLEEQAGWRLAFAVLGLAILAGALAVLRFLPRSRNFVAQSSWRRSLGDFGAHLRNPVLIATYAVGFSVLFSLVATFTYITFHLAAAPYSLGPAAQGMLFFVYLLGLVITPMSGAWIQRLGHHRMVPIAVAVSSLGVLLTLSPSIWIVVLGLALCSSGVFVCQTAASGYVGLAAPRARSAAAGLYVTFYYLGGSAGAAAPSYIWRIAGWPGCIALVVAVQAFAAAIALLFWKRKPYSALEMEEQA